ncbi:hypothetical protein ACIRBX_07045 [Kitasatospora sp. NPDC096147]|uniref:hypothetical protein n=1 Tax=Kitasatospora sp. NPDC096147 TaxID=3364093 RepID=UPI0038096A38
MPENASGEGVGPEGGVAEGVRTGRRMPRALGVGLAVAGLLAVTAASATVTVLVGKPDGGKAVAAPVAPSTGSAAPGASASPSTSASASATPSQSPSPSQSPTSKPKPSSTLHGTVDGATHGGDLRFFLLPMPEGAESYGPADGVKLSKDEVAEQFSNAAEMGEVLDSYGYRNDAAFRRYRTADGQQEVDVRLLRFKSRQMAKEFAGGMETDRGESFAIDGDPDGRGIMLKPEQEAWTGEMLGISSVGDVEYEVTVYVKGTPDKAALQDAMKRQRERLSSGG